MGLLDGRVALVTGASRGLGRAMCAVFAREGATVAFNYSRSDDEAAVTVEHIRGHGQRAMPFKVSVLDRVGLRAMIQEIEREAGRLDVLVNNAGVGQVLPLALMEEEDWDRMMDVHVKGAFLTTQAALRGMIRRRAGHVLNVGSLAGVKMMKAPVHYSTAKAALKGFTEALAKEIGHYGIQVNCIAPGVLEEGVSDNLPPDKRAEYLTFCALGRVGTCEEIAEVAAFLVSDRNRYMNGATVVLDGAV
jgi:3-oxoacyl-[acyl-carrier protein] reductase